MFWFLGTSMIKKDQARSQGGCEGCARTPPHRHLRSTFLLKNGVRGAPLAPPPQTAEVHFFLIAPPSKKSWLRAWRWGFCFDLSEVQIQIQSKQNIHSYLVDWFPRTKTKAWGPCSGSIPFVCLVLILFLL